MKKYCFLLILPIHLLFVSSGQAAGYDISHLFPVAGGVAHPSFIGSTNPVGFVYNNGANFVAFASTIKSSSSTSQSDPIYYLAGVSGGNQKVGGGLFLDGTHDSDNTPKNSSDLAWGFGFGLGSNLAIGVSGSNSTNSASTSGNNSSGSGIGAIGLVINHTGRHRLGIVSVDPGQSSSDKALGVGYAFSGSEFTFGFDTIYNTKTERGTTYLGVGLTSSKFQVTANYALGFDNSNTATSSTASDGAMSFGIGYAPSSSVVLAFQYAETNNYLAGFTYTF